MTTEMRDGSTVEDPRLGRLISFDPRSREYPVRTLFSALPGSLKQRSYSWRITGGVGQVLDQGQEGACVGFAWAADRAARPVEVPTTNAEAQAVYRRAKQIDEWPGEHYDGTSILAGAKAAVERGWLREYRWCFSLDDLITTLGFIGPVVLGIAWYESMYETAPATGGPRRHMLTIGGQQVGGHAILARGVNLRRREILLRNSWGPDWGVRGDAWLSFDDMARLQREQGEACVPLAR